MDKNSKHILFQKKIHRNIQMHEISRNCKCIYITSIGRICQAFFLILVAFLLFLKFLVAYTYLSNIHDAQLKNKRLRRSAPLKYRYMFYTSLYVSNSYPSIPQYRKSSKPMSFFFNVL